MPFQVTDEEALPILHDLLDMEGLLLGGSSAINVAGAFKMAMEMGPGHTICTILCDSGQRYQSKIWNPNFLRSKNLLLPHWLEIKGKIMQTTIVSADWLMAQDSAAITILDASYFLPTMGRDGRSEFAEEHIVSAAFFDIDTIKDETNPLPHMMPDAAIFEAAMRDIGVCSNKQIVVYDNSPFLSAARAGGCFAILVIGLSVS